MLRSDLHDLIDEIPDFPKKGILFKDVSPLIRQKFTETCQAMLDTMTPDELNKVDAFVALDSRGFIFASGMSALTGKGVIMARKPGKLPNTVVSESYDLEYGKAAIEMQAGEGNVFVVDDVLATGGSMTAGARAAEKAGYDVMGTIALINLQFLNNFEWKGQKCRTVLDYNAGNQLVTPAYKSQPELV